MQKKVLPARVYYKSSKRGTKEMGLILEKFNYNFAHMLDEKEMEAYEKVLDLTDQEIADYIMDNQNAHTLEVDNCQLKILNKLKQTTTRT